jgi:hypothetical protein
MKRISLKILLLVLLCSQIYMAQNSGDWLLHKIYGGTEYDEANAIVKTSDGSFVLSGYTQSFGLGRFGNAYIVKVDSSGDTLWTRQYGGEGIDVFADMLLTDNGSTISIGLTDTPNDWENIFIVKTNSDGETVWNKNYGGNQKDVGLSITEANDSGYVITGVTKSVSVGEEDLFILKTNADGDSLWFKTYGTIGNDGGHCINPVSTGGYIITGIYDWSTVWLLRIDENGDTLWTKQFGETDYDEGNTVIETEDGGFIICGSIVIPGTGELDTYVIKTDNIGNVLWEKTYGGPGYDEGREILQKPDEGFVILANTDEGVFGEFSYFVINTDKTGDTLWTRTYGGVGGTDRAFGIVNIGNGNYAIAGTTFEQASNGNATLSLICVEEKTTDVEEEPLQINSFTLFDAYPNPFNPTTKISWQSSFGSWHTLKIYDILGNEVATLFDGFRPAGIHTINFDAGNLASGTYYYKLTAGNYVETKKIVLMK